MRVYFLSISGHILDMCNHCTLYKLSCLCSFCGCMHFTIYFASDVSLFPGFQMFYLSGILLNEASNWILKHIIREHRPSRK